MTSLVEFEYKNGNSLIISATAVDITGVVNEQIVKAMNNPLVQDALREVLLPGTRPYVPAPAEIAAPIEMHEFLFSATIGRVLAEKFRGRTNIKGDEVEVAALKIVELVRGAMRLQRFSIFNWLKMHGVKIPMSLVEDRVHPEVGRQYPDRPVDVK